VRDWVGVQAWATKEINMRVLIVMAATGFFMSSGAAQHADQRQGQSSAGHISREIKALSPAQIEDLRAGRGMGLALPAELNSYPGPMHVLEFAEQLGLAEADKDMVREFIGQMRAETLPLGEKVIEAERALDRLFTERQADPDAVAGAVAFAAASHARLRTAHLRYHLIVRQMLTEVQINRYNTLRGYQ
jgi:hypothetical protein